MPLIAKKKLITSKGVVLPGTELPSGISAAELDHLEKADGFEDVTTSKRKRGAKAQDGVDLQTLEAELSAAQDAFEKADLTEKDAAKVALEAAEKALADAKAGA